jgi:hypothetical protein
MTILITAPGQFSGDDLKVGTYYRAEPAESGTWAQNRAFHALVQEYWVSGLHSYPAKTFEAFRNFIKRDLGAGFAGYEYIDISGHRRKSKEYPDDVMTVDGEPFIFGRLKSWSDYTKKERRETIDRLLAEMYQAGVNSAHFQEIIKGMEGLF